MYLAAATTSRRRAFTLIEILLVVALLAVLVAIILPTRGSRSFYRSSISRVQADMRSMQTALAAYRVDHGAYPLAMVEDHAKQVVGNDLSKPRAVVPSARVADLGPKLRSSEAALGRSRVALAHPSAAWNAPGGFATLTTPIAYLAMYFHDEFSPRRAMGFSYLPDGDRALLAGFDPIREWSPEHKSLSALGEAIREQFIDARRGAFDGTDYAGSQERLRCGTASNGRAFCYDPTNGLPSAGGVFRICE